MSRQIWTNFLVQKDSNYLDIKLKVFKRKKRCRISTEKIFYNGRSWFQSVYLTKKSTSCCSRQFSQRTKVDASSSIYTVQRHGGATEACSQKKWRCGLPKQKDLCGTVAIQGREPRILLCSILSNRTEGGGRKIQQFVYVNSKFDEFVYLLDVMKSVYDKVIANQPPCNAL